MALWACQPREVWEPSLPAGAAQPKDMPSICFETLVEAQRGDPWPACAALAAGCPAAEHNFLAFSTPGHLSQEPFQAVDAHLSAQHGLWQPGGPRKRHLRRAGPAAAQPTRGGALPAGHLAALPAGEQPHPAHSTSREAVAAWHAVGVQQHHSDANPPPVGAGPPAAAASPRQVWP